MTRPDWAAGVEWEGWKSTGAGIGTVRRQVARPNTGKAVASPEAKYLVISYDNLLVSRNWIVLPSPESALRIANAIAAEFGGWA